MFGKVEWTLIAFLFGNVFFLGGVQGDELAEERDVDVVGLDVLAVDVGQASCLEGALEGKKVVSASGGVSHSVAIAEGGECYYWGLAQWIEPVRLTALQHHNIVKVSCGKNFSVHLCFYSSLEVLLILHHALVSFRVLRRPEHPPAARGLCNTR